MSDPNPGSSPHPRAARLRIAGLWAAMIACDAAAQLAFKSAALRLPQPTPSLHWIGMVAQSPRAALAVACLACTFALWMLILRRSKLSSAFPVTALALVCVAVASHWLFDETLVPLQMTGIALIVAGVALLKPLDG
jgi:multidrug transporter EmrE-like cation transporter